MDDILKDPRFAKIATDKRFMSVSKKQKKVKIDKRFESMFNEEKFVSKCAVDKRGRPNNFTSKENYKRYYDLKDSDDSESDTDDDDTEDNVKSPKQESDTDFDSLSKTPEEVQTATSSGEESDDDSKEGDTNLEEKDDPGEKLDQPSFHLDPKVKAKLRDMNVDYARGEAALFDSDSDDSSSGEESSDEEEEGADGEEVFDKWGEMDADADRTEEVTDRLAVCNMDWDRVGAEDIFLALSSFCPAGGSVSHVKIFLSDFGRERLKDEEQLGPKELRKSDQDQDGDGGELVGEIDDDVSEAAAMARVRQYQINRLKYYYAVVKFDSKESANRVYGECDGQEYELSATRFDLRFVPDDMEFEDEPHATCLAPPRPETYKPKEFFTSALKQGKVNLTWDENDPQRAATMRKAFETVDDGDLGEVRNFLASSSDEEDETENKIAPASDEESSHDETEDKDAIAKYKALIAEINDSEEKKASEKGNLEVSWSANAEEEEQKDVQEDEEEVAPWEKYLKKKRDKKKQKKEKSKKDDDTTEKAFSDDELPDDVDFTDPFFAGEVKEINKKKKKKKVKEDIPEAVNEKDVGGLDLILMDSDDDKKHFNYKDIVETETTTVPKKKKWKKKKKDNQQAVTKKGDNFRVDVGDERFSALFTSANYNIDPSDPNYKKTNAMEELVKEKQKRRNHFTVSDVIAKKAKPDPEISSSVTKPIQSKKNKKGTNKLKKS